jgi:hypothetical protein
MYYSFVPTKEPHSFHSVQAKTLVAVFFRAFDILFPCGSFGLRLTASFSHFHTIPQALQGEATTIGKRFVEF